MPSGSKERKISSASNEEDAIGQAQSCICDLAVTELNDNRMVPMTIGKREPAWSAIKLAYLNAEGSYRELAKRFNVPFSSLEKRARREHWRIQAEKIGDAVVTQATKTATEQGRAIGMTAAELGGSSLSITKTLLRRIDELANNPIICALELRQLTAALRDVMGVGRTTLGLDQPFAQVSVNFGVSKALASCQDGDSSIIDVSQEEPLL